MNSVWEKLKNIGPDERKQGPLQLFGFVLLWLPCCMLEEGKDQLVNYSNIHLLRNQSDLLWYIAFSGTSGFASFMLFQDKSNPWVSVGGLVGLNSQKQRHVLASVVDSKWMLFILLSSLVLYSIDEIENQ